MISVSLGELFADRVPSVDPQHFPSETFELWSIPAFDAGQPEIVSGKGIGSAKKCLKPGDVLLSKIVPHIRRSWIVGPESGHRQIGSGEWIVFRSERVAPEYLRHFLTSDEFHTKFMGTIAGVGGSLMRARPEVVKQLKIPLPPLDEQRRVAAILDQVDALRRKRREAIRCAERIVASVFTETIGPSASREVSLGDVADIQVGHAFSSAKYTDELHGIRLCRGANVLPGRIDWSNLACWPREDQSAYSHLQLREDDVVIAMDRPWISEGFKLAQISKSDLPALLLQRVARIRGETRQLSNFFYHLLQQPAFTKHCKPTETTVPHISPTEVRSFKFAMPTAEQVGRFSMAAENLRILVSKQAVQLEMFERLFASLEHRAFRGEL